LIDLGQKELSSSVTDILAEIPLELRSTLSSLSDDTRFAILLTLLKRGEMSFSELSQSIGVASNVLSHHLRALTQAALVRNYYAKRGDSDQYSFYDTTALARDFIDRSLSAMAPRTALADILSRMARADQLYSESLADLVSIAQGYENEVGTQVTIAEDQMTLKRARRMALEIPAR
jgi:DNA-binding transcriptional ArsR family regulator